MPRYGILIYIFIMIILNCLWIISLNNIRRMSLSWWCHYVTYWYKIYDDIIWWLYMIMRCHEDTVMLRSTMGSYGRHVIEVVWEILTRKKWLGCRHDASLIFDIPGSTPMWAPYILFSEFQDIKTYMYYVFKSIHTIKEHWWFLILSWPDEVQRKFSTAQKF